MSCKFRHVLVSLTLIHLSDHVSDLKSVTSDHVFRCPRPVMTGNVLDMIKGVMSNLMLCLSLVLLFSVVCSLLQSTSSSPHCGERVLQKEYTK